VFLLDPRPWFSPQLETQGRQPGEGAGRPDQLKGEGIVAIIPLKTGRTGDEARAAGQEVSGDTSSLEDRSVLDALRV
jgi:hypothetical protein